jgi:hypothetical protein
MLHSGLLNLMIRSTCSAHHYAHHQELVTIQMAPACGTSPWLWQVAGLVHGCRFECPVRGMLHESCTSVCPCIADDMKRVKPTRCYTVVYWTLRFAQPVSGMIMPIIRSLWLYRWPQRVAPHYGYGRFLVWCVAVGLSVQLQGCCTTRPRVVQHPSNWTLKPTSRATSL